MSKTIICDICNKNISVENENRMSMGFSIKRCYRICETTKGFFKDREKTYDVCEDCFNYIKRMRNGEEE